MQVAVVVMMPNPHRPAWLVDAAGHSTSVKGKERTSAGYWDEEEEGVPDVVLGVAQVRYRGTDNPASPEL